jgi:hypothetical protein
LLSSSCSSSGNEATGSTSVTEHAGEPIEAPASTEPLSPLPLEECAEFKQIIAAGPAISPLAGRLDPEAHQALLAELDLAIAESPPTAQPTVETFAIAYREVLDELSNFEEDPENPGQPAPAMLGRIEAIMTRPEVIAATQRIEMWTQAC